MSSPPSGHTRQWASKFKHRALFEAALRTDRLDRNVVWVFGSPRSGSTWLYLMLSELEGVVAINEPHIGGYLGSFLCDLPGSTASAFTTEDFTVRRLQRSSPHQFFNDEFRDVWLKPLGALIRSRLLAHAHRYPSTLPLARTRVLVKEPNGSQSADVIMAAMPRSSLLFLLRDGRDVVDSELAANREGAWVSREFPGVGQINERDREEFVVQSASKWLWRTEVVEEAFRSHPGPRLLLRYEDLLEDPLSGLRQVVDWMGMTVPTERLAAVVSKHEFGAIPESQRGAKEFFRSARPGAWRQNLKPAEQAAVEKVIGAKLRQLGYEP